MWVYVYSDGYNDAFKDDAEFAEFLRDKYQLEGEDDEVIEEYERDISDGTEAHYDMKEVAKVERSYCVVWKEWYEWCQNAVEFCGYTAKELLAPPSNFSVIGDKTVETRLVDNTLIAQKIAQNLSSPIGEGFYPEDDGLWHIVDGDSVQWEISEDGESMIITWIEKQCN